MSLYYVTLASVDDRTLTAQVLVRAATPQAAIEAALDQEWSDGANWSNGARDLEGGDAVAQDVRKVDEAAADQRLGTVRGDFE